MEYNCLTVADVYYARNSLFDSLLFAVISQAAELRAIIGGVSGFRDWLSQSYKQCIPQPNTMYARFLFPNRKFALIQPRKLKKEHPRLRIA